MSFFVYGQDPKCFSVNYVYNVCGALSLIFIGVADFLLASLRGWTVMDLHAEDPAKWFHCLHAAQVLPLAWHLCGSWCVQYGGHFGYLCRLMSNLLLSGFLMLYFPAITHHNALDLIFRVHHVACSVQGGACFA